jgi:hypothetical protein
MAASSAWTVFAAPAALAAMRLAKRAMVLRGDRLTIASSNSG